MKKIFYSIMLGLLLTAMSGGCAGGNSGGETDDDTVINIAVITGITPPTYGETPVTEISETAQYTGTVSWSPAVSGTFSAATDYTATITLTPKSGYTLSGVAADFFTVAGATSNTNSADSGVVTAVFPDEAVSVTFSGVTQAGGTSGTADTTSLTLTFSVDPASLTADNITVTGAAKGTLTGTGITRTLAISGITVADGAAVSVEVISPAGFVISGSPQTAVVYRLLTIGMEYLGGKIAYFFAPGDTGYISGETHGLIAAASDQARMLKWALDAYNGTTVPAPGATSRDIGTGVSNTEAIVDQNDPDHSGLTSYAAGLCAAYEGGGYTDWYLPSRDELNKLFASKDLVGGYDLTYSYWSSTEYAGDGAWGQQFFGSGTAFILFKQNVIHVRAVRTF